jgi:hypothetical protein
MMLKNLVAWLTYTATCSVSSQKTEFLTLKGQTDGTLFSEQEQQAIIRSEDLSWMLANAQSI